jgi:aquaporin TIP
MYNLPQKLVAEFLGTFALVFFGEGAICAYQFMHTPTDMSLLGVAFAHGLAVTVAMIALMHISGGHFNPAVTIGLWVTKRLNTLDVLAYWAAQIAGAIAAAYVLRSVVPDDTWRAVALGTPDLARDFTRLSGMILEGVATFFIVLAFFATTVDEHSTSRTLAALAVGLTYAISILAIAQFTGGALNPARAFGPWVAMGGKVSNQGVYWVGPLAGGFVAGLLYDSVFLKKT